MKLDLNRLLDHADGDKLEPGESICPLMSQYQPHQGAMDKEPSLVAFTVLCVGKRCGRFNACMRLDPYTGGAKARPAS